MQLSPGGSPGIPKSCTARAPRQERPQWVLADRQLPSVPASPHFPVTRGALQKGRHRTRRGRGRAQPNEDERRDSVRGPVGGLTLWTPPIPKGHWIALRLLLEDPGGGGGVRSEPWSAPADPPSHPRQKKFPPAKNEIHCRGRKFEAHFRYTNWPLTPPLCDIPSGCCSFTGPWTVTRSSLRMLRRVAAFCRPLQPVLLLVSFPRSRSPIVGVLGLC